MSNKTEQETENFLPQNKTVFSILSNIKQFSDQTSETDDQFRTRTDPEVDDIAILRKNPGTNQTSINKSVYLKLHRSLSPNRSIVVDKIKEKYEHLHDEENNQIESLRTKDKQRKDTLETIKNRYSPAGLGYTNSKVPIPKPRKQICLINTKEILTKRKKEKRGFLNYNNKLREKSDINSNNLKGKSISYKDQKELEKEEQEELQEEFFRIVTRSDSEESVLKIQRELSIFTMDKKKRTNSFRKLFTTGKFFGGKDKKKHNEEKNTSPGRKAELSSENNQNEFHQFNRQSPHRHTIEGQTDAINNTKIRSEIDFNSSHFFKKQPIYNKHKIYEQNCNNPQQNNDKFNGYVPMDKPIFKSNDPNVYIQIPNFRKYTDNNSSASANTPESKRVQLHLYENQSYINQETSTCSKYLTSFPNKNYNCKRETPPRALETRQVVRLVSPKALIPINSEKSLSNPYQIKDEKQNCFLPNSLNTLQIKKNNAVALKPEYFEDVYGTVFDNVDYQRHVKNTENNKFRPVLNEVHKPPRSPSLEPSKLKLPLNRDTVQLSPRIKSPIPQEYVSTEKIIATELLKPKRSPTPTSPLTKDTIYSHQRQNRESSEYNSWDDKPIEVKNIPPKPPIRRSHDDSKSKNNLTSFEQASFIKGCKIDFSNVEVNEKDEFLENIPVELKNKPTVSMSKTFTSSRDDRLVASRRFYEVGHIEQISTPTSINSNIRIYPPKPEIINQNPHVNNIHNRVSIPSNESLNRVENILFYNSSPILRTPTPNKSISSHQSISMSPMSPQSGKSSSRPTTPLNARIPESPKTTPQKEEIRKSVEAYYWSEIRKLKDQENYDLYLYQMQYANLLPQNVAITNPDQITRSRSMSPSMHKNSKRSLSLPREGRSLNNSNLDGNQPTFENTTIIRSNPKSRSSQQNQFQESFLRNCPQRSTIDVSSSNRNYNSNSLYRPIFKRGSLSTPPKQVYEDQLKRKVSFSKNGRESTPVWPTRNGFTKSPPQRRLDNRNCQVDSYQDRIQSNMANLYVEQPTNNTFIMENPYGQRIGNNILVENIYGHRMGNQEISENPYEYTIEKNTVLENPYSQRVPCLNSQQIPLQNDEDLYGQPLDVIKRGLTRHGSIQIHEEMYGHRVQVPVKRISHQSYVPVRVNSDQESIYNARGDAKPLKRQIILKDDIFGQFGGYVSSEQNRKISHSQSKENIMEYNARIKEEYLRKMPLRQITVNNKVCDFYGQIHDTNSSNKLQSNGVLMGQLHRNLSSPPVERNSYSQLPPNQNFVRNSRLTASANDMVKRVPNIHKDIINDRVVYGAIYTNNGQSVNGAPTRPLPPIPPTKIKPLLRTVQVSDTESGSDASEIQRILNSKTKIT